MICISSSDGQEFTLTRNVALLSGTIMRCLEDAMVDDKDKVIPLPQVDSDILARVLTFCKYYVNIKKEKNEDGKETFLLSEQNKHWTEQFLNEIDIPTLLKLVVAANYMEVKPLLEQTVVAIANLCKGKTAAQIRETFGLPDDLTEEEKNEIKKELEFLNDP